MSKTNSIRPEQVQAEYRAGVDYKRQLGERGLYEQSRINERFYAGDQWHGVNCGDSRPLVRHNVIKRIGDYKMAVVGTAPVSVRFSAEGVPLTSALQRQVEEHRAALREGGKADTLSPSAAAQTMASALTDYFATTADRLKLEDLKQRVLRNAYISGTGVLYTYWDDRVRTGLYADQAHTTPICGDIAAEVLEVEQVYPVTRRWRIFSSSRTSSFLSGAPWHTCAAWPRPTGAVPGSPSVEMSRRGRAVTLPC